MIYYSKTSGILCKNVQAVNSNGAIADFNAANATNRSFNIKTKITGQTGNTSTNNVEIMVPLKHLSNFWRTLEIPFIDCEINLDLNFSKSCVIVAKNAD